MSLNSNATAQSDIYNNDSVRVQTSSDQGATSTDSPFGGNPNAASSTGNSTAAYGQSQSVGADGGYAGSDQPSYAGGRSDEVFGGQARGNATATQGTGAESGSTVGNASDSTTATQSRETFSGKSGDPLAVSGAGDAAPGAGQLDEDGYPEQRHAGKVGYGPNYHKGPTVGDRLEGQMDILKGKILKKPELVEEGQLKKSGEKKDETQDDAEDPYTTAKEGTEATGNTRGDGTQLRDSAATSGNKEAY